MSEYNKNRAKRLLVHYFKLSMEHFDEDNQAEIEEIIDLIFDEIKENKED